MLKFGPAIKVKRAMWQRFKLRSEQVLGRSPDIFLAWLKHAFSEDVALCFQAHIYAQWEQWNLMSPLMLEAIKRLAPGTDQTTLRVAAALDEAIANAGIPIMEYLEMVDRYKTLPSSLEAVANFDKHLLLQYQSEHDGYWPPEALLIGAPVWYLHQYDPNTTELCLGEVCSWDSPYIGLELDIELQTNSCVVYATASDENWWPRSEPLDS
ncbi:MAG: hypothetical protein NTZ65_03735 [Candidatus Berkelbacteria bacterium]|nr:hypothetical protein [Candidatus Berkelbacteria bacterium]